FMRHQDESRRTETALERTLLDESLLHRTEVNVVIEVLDRRDGFAVDESRRIQAARHGDVVDDHGAATAETLAAALASAIQIQPAQQFDEIFVSLDKHLSLASVQHETDRLGVRIHLNLRSDFRP